MIRLHPNAATTPRTRKLIQQATGNNREIARQFGVSDQTVRRWRQRQD
ncbi:MAG: helix-turn-helix domain-containing protein, partial [Puniceicoccaceae bacterium]